MRKPRDTDKRGVRYAIPASENYLTSREVATAVDTWPETVWRWCRQWFGELPPGRNGKGMGYRIPPVYVRIARAWKQVTDDDTRDAVRKALLDAEASEDSLGNFVVVVGNVGKVLYTVNTAVESGLALHERFPHSVIYLIPVGEPKEDNND